MRAAVAKSLYSVAQRRQQQRHPAWDLRRSGKNRCFALASAAGNEGPTLSVVWGSVAQMAQRWSLFAGKLLSSNFS